MQFATDDEDIAAMLHTNIGYRTRISNNCLFVPKVGVAGGYFGDTEGTILVGPSIDLALELKHFVIGLTGFYSINTTEHHVYNFGYHDNIPMLSLTLGYTF